jgi:hypothetical protein
MPRHYGCIVGSKNDPRHLGANKISDELLQSFIAVKIDFVVDCWIIMENFRQNFIFCPATHDNFIQRAWFNAKPVNSPVEIR